MGLIKANQIAKFINLNKFGFVGHFIGWLILKTLRISKINRIYNRNKHLKGTQFLDAILDDFKVSFEIPEKDYKRLPKDGGFIVVANHPLGGIDGIILLKIMLEAREDSKIMANFLLNRIKPLSPYILAVNPFENYKKAFSSTNGLKETIKHLNSGKPIGIFPAGEVSTDKDGEQIIDRPWSSSALKIIQKAEVPIVPMYFHAKNSKLFYFLSKQSDLLRTAKLPSELLSQNKRTIKVRIGKSIPVKEQKKTNNLDEFEKFLRQKIYMLSNPFEKHTKSISRQTFKLPIKPKQITGPAKQD